MPDKIDYEMQQELEVNDEVLTAILDVWGKWDVAADQGIVEFIVYLQKPDSSDIELYNQQKSAGSSGQGYLLTDEDIKANFDQQGTYKLRLLCGVKSNDALVKSYGWYDNISLLMTVKKTKTVVESIGGGESYDSFCGKVESEKEDLQLAESHSIFLRKGKVILEPAGLSEILQISRTAGNIIEVIVIGGQAQWNDRSKVTTKWDKRKTEAH